MAEVVVNPVEVAQTAGELMTDNTTAAFAAFNDTQGWTIGPDGEFDGDPEEPRYAVLVFYCILVSVLTRKPAVTLTAYAQRVVQAVMIGAQSALFYWKKKQKRSYELVRQGPSSRLIAVAHQHKKQSALRLMASTFVDPAHCHVCRAYRGTKQCQGVPVNPFSALSTACTCAGDLDGLVACACHYQCVHGLVALCPGMQAVLIWHICCVFYQVEPCFVPAIALWSVLLMSASPFYTQASVLKSSRM